ncbi:uncharacterized protein LOC142403671 [Mycteria americana]|uniref:uncharacterized protein LOC142403671 n=1 Tax=Mycteria americana TaxID=33587 RepID=UPI003F58A534
MGMRARPKIPLSEPTRFAPGTPSRCSTLLSEPRLRPGCTPAPKSRCLSPFCARDGSRAPVALSAPVWPRGWDGPRSPSSAPRAPGTGAGPSPPPPFPPLQKSPPGRPRPGLLFWGGFPPFRQCGARLPAQRAPARGSPAAPPRPVRAWRTRGRRGGGGGRPPPARVFLFLRERPLSQVLLFLLPAQKGQKKAKGAGAAPPGARPRGGVRPPAAPAGGLGPSRRGPPVSLGPPRWFGSPPYRGRGDPLSRQGLRSATGPLLGSKDSAYRDGTPLFLWGPQCCFGEPVARGQGWSRITTGPPRFFRDSVPRQKPHVAVKSSIVTGAPYHNQDLCQRGPHVALRTPYRDGDPVSL